MFNKRTPTTSSAKTKSTFGSKCTTTKTASKNIQSTSISPDSPEASVIIPCIKTQDNNKILPKYTNALNKPKDDYYPAEDLDSVQFELESLLSTVALRYRILKSELEAIEKEDRRDRKKLLDKSPLSPGKRKHTEDKKLKDRTFPPYKIGKQKIHSPVLSLYPDDSTDTGVNHFQKENTKPLHPKNDTPNKFWLSVEPYCMPVTNEDLKLIDDLLDQYSGPLVPPIPELGPHYSTTWAFEEMKEEQDNSLLSKSITKSSTDATKILKKGEKLMGEGVTGPLTQRLVSAFIEENIVSDGFSNADSNSSIENTNSIGSLRSISLMKNGIAIEKRVKKELIEQGLLEPDDYEKEQEDEILAEIKRVLSELSAIAEYNNGELKNLQAAAKEELKRLEVKRSLDKIDHEILETYKKVTTAKQKRRSLTKQEQEDIYKLLDEQKKLSDQLDMMIVPGSN